MITLDIANLLASSNNLVLISDKITNFLETQSGDRTSIEAYPARLLIVSLNKVGEAADALRLPATIGAVRRAQDHLKGFFPTNTSYLISTREISGAMREISHVGQIMSDELEGREALLIESRFAGLLKSDHPFGESVRKSFPTSNPEILQAARCRAFECWTASVMHLMRALEPPLMALQNAVGVTVQKEQWGQILDQIEKKIREINRSSHSKIEEQFYSEAASHFRLIKNAWRNHSQHLSAVYDEEQCETIYNNVRAFMVHLSASLTE